MGATGNIINLIGLVFLAHAVYSAYEHSLLPTAAQISSQSTFLPTAIDPKINIPIDITLETIFSVLLLCVGVVLNSPDLKPIQWNVWAGNLERSKEARKITEFGVGGGNPFAALEERPAFLDVRAKRNDYAAWAQNATI